MILAGLQRTTRTIGVDMPNNNDQISRTDDWKNPIESVSIALRLELVLISFQMFQNLFKQ